MGVIFTVFIVIFLLLFLLLRYYFFITLLQVFLPGLIYICAKEGAEMATNAAPTVKMMVIINSFIFLPSWLIDCGSNIRQFRWLFNR